MDKPISSVRSERIKRRIIKVSDAIRKKYKALTLGMKEQDAALSKLFTPVLSPLKEISTKIDDTYKHQQQPQKLGIVERDNEARELSTPSMSKRVKTYGRNQNQRVVEFSFLPPRSINQPLESSNNRAKNDEERETDDSVMMNDDEQLHRQQDDEETLDENFEKDVEEDEEVFEYKPEEEEMKTEYETASKLNLSDIKQPEVFEDFLSQFPDISKPSIIKVLNEENDEVYGPRYDLETNKFHLGNITLNITDNGDFQINNQLFPATEGLYTLLFSKNPDSETIVINDKDRKIYKQMLEISNAHKRDYDPEQQIKGSRGEKYLQHIQPLFSKTTDKKRSKSTPQITEYFPEKKRSKRINTNNESSPSFSPTLSSSRNTPPTASIIPTRTTLMRQQRTYSVPNTSTPTLPLLGKKSGRGLYNNNFVTEYVYYDAFDELVERLNLLHASVKAGNTTHINEIRSIEEELREADVIY
ncbi:hypothetical protein Zmor_024492 [Zophobas morio]|uniref:DUF8207 domain-containing protein n=1 Tax=Zophobas morio TaxID=2755281 RepID=A0AA38I0P2_9CUCU|nr:hypothetical protein Zmor_024492 [Zophobas morio]